MVGAVNRVDGKRVLSVKADIVEGILADDKISQIQDWLSAVKLNLRIDVTSKGENEEKKLRLFLTKPFGIALFIMATIFVTQFNSFI